MPQRDRPEEMFVPQTAQAALDEFFRRFDLARRAEAAGAPTVVQDVLDQQTDDAEEAFIAFPSRDLVDVLAKMSDLPEIREPHLEPSTNARLLRGIHADLMRLVARQTAES
ncbi:MAG: hypothetical protein AAFY02_11570 [Pseudomonadota bacterium]